ncbi:hypothetical protein A2709_02485 [candidate division WWE3 bacterium RIFCSPHIGHO2_01_FULL_43_9]|uniref:ATPase F1/V1/A1 complex alpha/beta subunit nucleotide-binding domain-containing protein n=1 Tax=candidate division WWE3 bacterium RIFCSPHIGHO2_01_FULL_43_9 TaxID=1802618 RepID=A0A1F4V259_UNCKA|nr:MAG: hypothetical protein A2709_02485 [candidate division WWE3 bacterium RIFCSPHIGHO2_01_FULL_43_9]
MKRYDYKTYTSDDFAKLLNDTGEIGFVEGINPPIISVSGLPGLKSKEIVLFENGAVGQTMSLLPDSVEIVNISSAQTVLGERVCRTGSYLEIPAGDYLLGLTVDPLGNEIRKELSLKKVEEYRNIEAKPPGIDRRVKLNQYFETGVAVVDMMVPIGKGQRELIIGDRKSGKTEFILQTMLNQAKKGAVCIYAGIGKSLIESKKIADYVVKNDILNRSVIVSSYAADSPALIYLTPYTAMAIAEHFLDKGTDVFLVLDDLTTHAKYYRELSLAAGRFPGRSSYPADVFYTHSRLLERAGYFKTKNGINSITCFPVAESVEGDFSGYIQTNLMSITDGHIYFDKELFLQGRKPAVNYFLSVTRVGRQTQTKLKWSISRELGSFLTLLERTQSFVHFGAEINEGIKSTLTMGDRLTQGLFNQTSEEILPTNLQIVLFTLIWSQAFKDSDSKQLVVQRNKIIQSYKTDASYRTTVDKMVESCDELNKLLGLVSSKQTDLL